MGIGCIPFIAIVWLVSANETLTLVAVVVCGFLFSLVGTLVVTVRCPRCDQRFYIPWGLNVDGKDDVWVGNMWSRSATLLAGDNTKGHAPGTKVGDVLHVFQSGSIQVVTDVSIDPAGNVWVANNWNNVEGAAGENPSRPISTWGGGSGFTVIYGVAGPVMPPRIGKVRPY